MTLSVVEERMARSLLVSSAMFKMVILFARFG